jgi:hypothetical protein
MYAYTGPYRVEGDRLTVKVEVAWNEAWIGTDQRGRQMCNLIGRALK